jgi:hypothetical protein
MSLYRKIQYYFFYRSYLKRIAVDLRLLNYRVDWLGRVYTIVPIKPEFAANKKQVPAVAEFLATQHVSNFKLRFADAEDYFYSQAQLLDESNLLIIHEFAFLDVRRISKAFLWWGGLLLLGYLLYRLAY